MTGHKRVHVKSVKPALLRSLCEEGKLNFSGTLLHALFPPAYHTRGYPDVKKYLEVRKTLTLCVVCNNDLYLLFPFSLSLSPLSLS